LGEKVTETRKYRKGKTVDVEGKKTPVQNGRNLLIGAYGKNEFMGEAKRKPPTLVTMIKKGEP